MTTLLVSEVFPPRTGGSGRWFWEIYRRLPRRDYLVAAGACPGDEAFDATHDLRLTRLPLSFSTWGLGSLAGLRQYGRTLRTLRSLIKENGIRSLHCGKCLPEGLLAWLLKHWQGMPYRCYVHGEELNLAAGSRELRWWSRRVLHAAEAVIANSRNTERILQEDWQLPPGRIHVLHPGVDAERFTPAARNAEIRAKLRWGNRPVILTVGRLQKRKGHDQLILGLPEIRKTIPNVLYAIVGDGEERPSLERLVKQEGLAENVLFHGELTDGDLVCCYQQCDIFVLPNRQVGKDIEGFGMVLLEAQACGKPVIAGASGGTAETMDEPATGRVVPCETPESLAKVLVELLHDPDRLTAMGSAARQWAVEHFDWPALCTQAAELFDDRVKASSRPELEPAHS